MDQRPAESPLFNPGSKADRPTADDNVTATSGGGEARELENAVQESFDAGRER